MKEIYYSCQTRSKLLTRQQELGRLKPAFGFRSSSIRPELCSEYGSIDDQHRESLVRQYLDDWLHAITKFKLAKLQNLPYARFTSPLHRRHSFISIQAQPIMAYASPSLQKDCSFARCQILLSCRIASLLHAPLLSRPAMRGSTCVFSCLEYGLQLCYCYSIAAMW